MVNQDQTSTIQDALKAFSLKELRLIVARHGYEEIEEESAWCNSAWRFAGFGESDPGNKCGVGNRYSASVLYALVGIPSTAQDDTDLYPTLQALISEREAWLRSSKEGRHAWPGDARLSAELLVGG
jgi:hypothetical protein